MVVSEDESHVVSYVTCQTDSQTRRGIIILVATAEWARGRGAAWRASMAALHWFVGHGMRPVEVGTQLCNIPAARLYASLGFRLTPYKLHVPKASEMRNSFLPYCIPMIGEEEIAEVADSLRSGWVTTRPKGQAIRA